MFVDIFYMWPDPKRPLFCLPKLLLHWSKASEYTWASGTYILRNSGRSMHAGVTQVCDISSEQQNLHPEQPHLNVFLCLLEIDM